MGKIGLVLEGGAMRGMFTAGVLDAFLEKDIPFDGIIGVSAGALFGVNYLSRQRGRVIRYNKRFNRDKNYMGLRPLLREGNLVSPPTPTGRCPASWMPLTMPPSWPRGCPSTPWSPTWPPASRPTCR